MKVALKLVVDTIDHPWESLRMVLERHGTENLGDPFEEGTGAWHLRHIAETFRLHADHASNSAVQWPALPDDSAKFLETIGADIRMFITWTQGLPLEDLVSRRLEYHHLMDFSEMVGIMGRHIVWHAAAIHYWLLWKRPDPASV